MSTETQHMTEHPLRPVDAYLIKTWKPTSTYLYIHIMSYVYVCTHLLYYISCYSRYTTCNMWTYSPNIYTIGTNVKNIFTIYIYIFNKRPYIYTSIYCITRYKINTIPNHYTTPNTAIENNHCTHCIYIYVGWVPDNVVMMYTS